MRSLMLFLIGLTFGAAGGFVYAAANGFTLDGHDHADAAQHGGAAGMDHGTGAHAAMHDQPIDLSPADAPQLAIAVTKDPMTGHNLQVSVDGFAFAPQAASMALTRGLSKFSSRKARGDLVIRWAVSRRNSVPRARQMP